MPAAKAGIRVRDQADIANKAFGLAFGQYRTILRKAHPQMLSLYLQAARSHPKKYNGPYTGVRSRRFKWRQPDNALDLHTPRKPKWEPKDPNDIGLYERLTAPGPSTPDEEAGVKRVSFGLWGMEFLGLAILADIAFFLARSKSPVSESQ
ncbi:MAG: hypothetical protein ABJD75_11940 [Parasphingorhabdus sp.]|uniref:hypothetical protein n=1 Tax=Parasphingorhabdus sp. TaxID=2709688 RepID=UPI00326521A7